MVKIVGVAALFTLALCAVIAMTGPAKDQACRMPIQIKIVAPLTI